MWSIQLLIVSILFGAALSIVIHPSELRRPANQSSVLTCIGNGSLTWFGPNGQKLTSNSRVQVNSFGSGRSLVNFRAPKTEESGIYRCRSLKGEEARVKVTFYAEMRWSDCDEEQFFIAGQGGNRISCKVTSDPPPEITWYKGDDVITNSPRYQITKNGLNLRSVPSPADGGSYSIRAYVEETASLEFRVIQVSIYDKPVIRSVPKHIQTTAGESKEIRCLAKGKPRPSIWWLNPKGANVSELTDYQVKPNEGVLRLLNVSQADAGNFTCVAMNAAGTARRKVMVHVRRKPNITLFVNQSGKIGDKVTLTCQVTGNPRPEVTIVREVEEGAEGERLVVKRKTLGADEAMAEVVFSSLNTSNSGRYVCRATSEAGSSTHEASVEVESPPYFQTSESFFRTYANKDVRLNCEANGVPTPSITWFHKGQQLGNSTRYQIVGTMGSSQLLVRKPNTHQSYGKYSCSALNKHGSMNHVVDLSEAQVPGFVSSVSMQPTPRGVYLNVSTSDVDEEYPITFLIVEWKPKKRRGSKFEQKKFSWQYASGSQMFHLTGLAPLRTYEIRFRLENEVGSGAFEKSYEFRTPNVSVPDVPEVEYDKLFGTARGGDVLSDSPTSFELRWTRPADNGRPIDFYEIKYYKTEKRSDGEWAKSETSTNEAVSLSANEEPRFLIKDIEPESYYRVELRAHNSIGFSKAFVLVFQTPSSAPLTGTTFSLSLSASLLALLVSFVY